MKREGKRREGKVVGGACGSAEGVGGVRGEGRGEGRMGVRGGGCGSRFAVGPVFADINLGVGYMHSWAAGVIYQRTENGGVEKAANLGHPHFMPNASFRLGWDGSRRNDLPWTIHIGPEVYLQYPYNHIFLPHVAAKIGFTYKFKQR